MTDPASGRGSLRSRGAALVSTLTLRQISAVLPPEQAWGLWLSRLTGLPVFAVDYRLAPRHRFPTVRAGWDWLTSQVPPERVVIVGDSAGGHLSVDLLLQPDVTANGPAALTLFSPLIDLTFGLAADRERCRPDPTMRAVHAAPAHRRLSLDVAGGPALPPTLIQAGGAEMLVADAQRLAADVRAAGGLTGSRQCYGACRAFHRNGVASQRV